ncbi:MAG: cyclic dehypoxanthinyl futalosine synthase, partial [Conexivisphaera sp.]
MSDIVEKALSGEALDVGDVEELMKEDIWILGRAAARLTESIFKGRVTFVSNMILNYTNVCTVACRFCAFYRPPGHPEAYVRSPEEAARAAAEVYRAFEIRQILVQGGVNPELDVEYYEEMFRRLKERVPDAAIHGLSPIEVDYLAKRGRMSYREVLGRLRDAGMDTMAGGGGEILVDRVRRIIAPRKMSADSWLKVMEVAHGMGIMTNATMMYGHAETIRDRAEHLHRILELQRRTHGFLSFTAWNFEPGNSELTREFPYPMTAATLLRTVAVARLIFRDLLPNIQSSWLTNGLEAARMAMRFGANDFGGTLFDEMVMPATGLRAATVTRERIVDMIRSMGMRPAERDNWYRVIAEYRYRGRRQGKKIADPTRSVLEPSERAEIGIIGGSGLYSLEGIEDVREIKVHTPYGEPSDNLVLGSLGGRSIAFLPRHGRGHRIPPHRVNYRANVWA